MTLTRPQPGDPLASSGGKSSTQIIDEIEDLLESVDASVLSSFREGVDAHSDFLNAGPLVDGTQLGEFYVELSGTGTGISTGTGELNHPGVLTASTGSTTGSASIQTPGGAIMLGGGSAYFGATLKTSTLSTSTERYDLQVGFCNNGSGDSRDGVYLRYSDNINGGKWQAIAACVEVFTVLDSGISVTADTWYTLEVQVNAAGSSAEFFLNGSSFGTITTDIPTVVNRETGAGLAIWKSVGTTARTVDWDAYKMLLNFTTMR